MKKVCIVDSFVKPRKQLSALVRLIILLIAMLMEMFKR